MGRGGEGGAGGVHGRQTGEGAGGGGGTRRPMAGLGEEEVANAGEELKVGDARTRRSRDSNGCGQICFVHRTASTCRIVIAPVTCDHDDDRPWAAGAAGHSVERDPPSRQGPRSRTRPRRRSSRPLRAPPPPVPWQPVSATICSPRQGQRESGGAGEGRASEERATASPRPTRVPRGSGRHARAPRPGRPADRAWPPRAAALHRPTAPAADAAATPRTPPLCADAAAQP